jgi:hypothetical protein
MTRSLHFPTLPRTIAAGVAALVLAASAAPAFAASSESGPQQLCAGVTLQECERQVLASRGTGDPAAMSSAGQSPSSDAGSGWSAEAVGAAAVGAVSLVGLLGVIAFRRRRHWRPARSAASH